jgi:hypothetical protein
MILTLCAEVDSESSATIAWRIFWLSFRSGSLCDWSSLVGAMSSRSRTLRPVLSGSYSFASVA